MMTTTPEPALRDVRFDGGEPKQGFRVARAFSGDSRPADAGEASAVSREQDTTNTN